MSTLRLATRSGFTLIEMMAVLPVIAIIAAIAIPNLLDARKGANESSAIGTLRAVNNAQGLFISRDIDGDGVVDYADSLEELHEHGLIDDELATGQKSGYLFRMTGGADDAWSMRAVPEEAGVSGIRSFFIDETGVIRYSTCGEAGPESPPIEDEDGEPVPEEHPCVDQTEWRTNAKARRSVEELLRIGGSELLDDAIARLDDPKVVLAILQAMDTDGSGGVSLEEAFSADILAIARQTAPAPGGPTLPRKDEARVFRIPELLQRFFRIHLPPRLPSETAVPELDPTTVSGHHAAAFLRSFGGSKTGPTPGGGK